MASGKSSVMSIYDKEVLFDPDVKKTIIESKQITERTILPKEKSVERCRSGF